MSRLEEFYNQFRKHYAEFVHFGGEINVWKIACINTDEIRNSAVLGWLLDCHGSHGQGAAFLRCYLESQQTLLSQELLKSLSKNETYRTSLERKYDEGSTDSSVPNSRVDIVIENELFLLFIEVKIYAPETGNQLERYMQILNSRSCGRKAGLFFLTIDGHMARESSVEKVVCLSWKHVAASFEKYIYTQNSNSGKTFTAQPLWISIVNHFCHHIRNF